MTDLLDRARALEQAASKPPWEVIRSYPELDVPRYEALGDGGTILAVSGYQEANTQLAVVSRNTWLGLLEALQKAEELIADELEPADSEPSGSIGVDTTRLVLKEARAALAAIAEQLDSETQMPCVI